MEKAVKDFRHKTSANPLYTMGICLAAGKYRGRIRFYRNGFHGRLTLLQHLANAGFILLEMLNRTNLMGNQRFSLCLWFYP